MTYISEKIRLAGARNLEFYLYTISNFHISTTQTMTYVILRTPNSIAGRELNLIQNLFIRPQTFAVVLWYYAVVVVYVCRQVGLRTITVVLVN